MKPKGTIIIIGGAEDRGQDASRRKNNNQYEPFEVLKQLIPENDKNERIEIITTASGIPGEMRKMYTKAFKEIGYSQVGFIDIENKTEARELKFCKKIEKAHAVLFSGGNQFKLVTTLGGTETVEVIKEKYESDSQFIVAGTSAGAMAIPKLMIYEGGKNEAMLKDDLKISSGLGILDNCIVDTHFIKRGRFGRLAHAVTMNPEQLGIGLGEDTALVIRNGIEASCSGSGMVVIIDGSEITGTNISEIEGNDPIYVKNLKVDLLVKGNSFCIVR